MPVVTSLQALLRGLTKTKPIQQTERIMPIQFVPLISIQLKCVFNVLIIEEILAFVSDGCHSVATFFSITVPGDSVKEKKIIEYYLPHPQHTRTHTKKP